ncbi:hypothetical protein [Roseococcus sp. SYP-B2431]|uniref:hypothetical protein n=1 Tax=Roseococcus sp. SYP-B2431 TaxID=2496640 RepID=UPI0013F3B301|nr:hypothetical protein [Roseococcus sp. SYP-B2431]
MIRIAPASITTLALIIGLGFAANPAASQQVTSQGAIHGQSWNMGQDFESLNAMSRPGSPLARDRAARAARQAQFNRPVTGVPVRTASTQAR